MGSSPTPGTKKGQVDGLEDQAEVSRGHRMVTSRAEHASPL